VARPLQRPTQAATIVSRPAASSSQTSPPAQGSVLAKIAALERTSSNCTDGCQTSFKNGNQPWNGCSLAAGFSLSATCRNIRNFKAYFECRDYEVFLAWKDAEIWWYCTSLLAGGRFTDENHKVVERSGLGNRPYRAPPFLSDVRFR
jgi:hypothetical protein